MSRVELPLTSDVPVACALSAGDLGVRVAEWRTLLARAERVERPEPATMVLHLPPRVAVGELADLCVQEVACCPFFAFQLEITETGVSLTVRVPPEAAQALTALLPPDAGAAG